MLNKVLHSAVSEKKRSTSRQWLCFPIKELYSKLRLNATADLSGPQRPFVQAATTVSTPKAASGSHTPTALRAGVSACHFTGCRFVSVSGFQKTELNTLYVEDSQQLNGQTTFWDKSGTYYIYWCSRNSEYQIGSQGDWNKNLGGGCYAFASAQSSAHFTNANWEEWWDSSWQQASAAQVVCSGMFVALSGALFCTIPSTASGLRTYQPVFGLFLA